MYSDPCEPHADHQINCENKKVVNTVGIISSPMGRLSEWETDHSELWALVLVGSEPKWD